VSILKANAMCVSIPMRTSHGMRTYPGLTFHDHIYHGSLASSQRWAFKRCTGDWYKPQLFFATCFQCPLKRNKCEASFTQTDRDHSYQRLRCSSSARALGLWFLHTSSARCIGYTVGLTY